ncbi:MAG: DinB family protein [Saprospiraceae bacterium]|nr:DinB family protein [Saprospiraceae bacterium]
MQGVIEHIIRQLVNNQEGKAWIGPTYQRKLKDITDENAFTRPLPDLHSVAEIISHLTTWQKETILKIRTGEGSLTDDCEENWYANDKLREKKWATIWKEYQETLAEIIALLQTKEDSFLQEQYYDTDFKGNYPYSFVINGMLHHNLYHLGQLGIIVKYLKLAGKY